MKLNDVRVLRNMLGDKIEDDDHDEFLERKIPKFTPKKLALGKLPKRDMYGRNMEPSELNEVLEEATGQPVGENTKAYTEGPKTNKPRKINVDKPVKVNKGDPNYEEITSLNQATALNKAKAQYAQSAAESIKSSATTDLLYSFTKPKVEAPSTKTVKFGIPFTSKRESSGQVSQLKFGIEVPTSTGFYKGLERFSKNVATPMTQNLGNIGGSIVGDFGEQASTKKYNSAIGKKQSYIQYLRAKYLKKGYNISNEQDVLSVANYSERQKIQALNQEIGNSRTLVSNQGFMSGTGARAIAYSGRSQSQNLTVPKINALASMGGPRSNYGSFGPEAMSRLSVGQGLTTNVGGYPVTMTPENKWGVLFNNTSSLNSTDKLTRIIGKAPQPGMQRPEDKLDKYMNKFNSGNFNNKLKKYL